MGLRGKVDVFLTHICMFVTLFSRLHILPALIMVQIVSASVALKHRCILSCDPFTGFLLGAPVFVRQSMLLTFSKWNFTNCLGTSNAALLFILYWTTKSFESSD